MPLFGSPLSALIRSLLAPVRETSLLKAFIAHQVSSRYAGSMGGLLWTFAHPMAQIAVYSFIFHVIFRVRFNELTEGTSSFILFFLTGFFPWLFFSESLERGCRSILDNAVLVTKVAFPSELLPLSSTIAAHILNSVGFLCLALYLAWARSVSSVWVFLPLVFTAQVLFTAGLVYILSALTVFFRDVHEILRIALTIWFYATPILYPLSFVPEGYRLFLHINPMTFFVDCYRHIFFFSSLPWRLVAGIVGLATVSYVAGFLFFRRSKNAFGDVL